MPPRRSRLPAALLLVVLVAVSAAVAWAGSSQSGTLEVPREPSIPAGRAVFEASCSSCHGAPGRFGAGGWRRGLSPADVTRIALGEERDHPAAITDLGDAWDATAYVWTLATNGPQIRHGETLAYQASDALRQDAVGVALFHWHQVERLKDRTWVLNHDAEAVDGLMTDLAGSRFTGLSEGERNALTEYIFASYFTWPPSW